MSISVEGHLRQVRREHRTNKFKSGGLIVRRGFPVLLETSATSLLIRLVPTHPQNTSDLGYSFELTVDEPVNDWTLEPAEDDGFCNLNIPPNAVIGMYAIETEESKLAMAVLFNPFCEADEVYMENEEELNEYLLNDVGRIWVGSSSSPSGIPWSFAQFRTKCLLSSLHFLDAMAAEDRHDPVKVSRHLSAALNSQDDNGVLAGRWDGEYSDGTSPSAWTGSAEILKQYWKSLSPVRYGQCWVFSGVLTTVMRALGLASRSITNFVSAHDTTQPYNRAVDKYYDSQGEPLDHLSNDSTWNFHVWNEAWMRRSDLQELADEHGLQYDGWQILDATPQEESSGLYQLGPAPLIGIKHGYTLDYDTDFVIGEVNADVIHYWQVEGTEDFEARAKYPRHIGQKISTKAIGVDDRHDVTLDYKFEEGTEEERASLANRPSGEIEPEPEPSTDIQFEVECPPDVKVSETITFVIKATNTGGDPHDVHFNCLYRATDYTGAPKAQIDVKQEDNSIEPEDSCELIIEVLPEQYEPFLASGVQTIQFNSSAKVAETGQVWSMETIVRLNADETLDLRAPETASVGSSECATAVITNISNMPLTCVVLRAEGEGLLDLLTVPLDDIEPGDSIEYEIPFEPSEEGDKLLVTTLDTAELKDISRSAHIIVGDTDEATLGQQTVWEGQQAESMDQLVEIQSREV